VTAFPPRHLDQEQIELARVEPADPLVEPDPRVSRDLARVGLGAVPAGPDAERTLERHVGVRGASEELFAPTQTVLEVLEPDQMVSDVVGGPVLDLPLLRDQVLGEGGDVALVPAAPVRHGARIVVDVRERLTGPAGRERAVGIRPLLLRDGLRRLGGRRRGRLGRRLLVAARRHEENQGDSQSCHHGLLDVFEFEVRLTKAKLP